ncbi:MAG: MMPL family transporter, partial [Frankia sp.]
MARNTTASATRPDAAPPRPGLLARLGRGAARRAVVVLACWLLALVAVIATDRAVGGRYADDLTLPGSEAQQGLDLLKASDPGAGGSNGQVVFAVGSGTVAEQRSAVEQAVANLRAKPHVLAVSDPLAGPAQPPPGQTPGKPAPAPRSAIVVAART